MKGWLICVPVLFLFLWTGMSRGALASRSLADPASFYVATNGNDGWSGSLAEPNRDETDGPFATLERARNAVRTLKKSGSWAGNSVIVEVRGGYYSLSNTFELQTEDSGSPGAPVVYRARSGETVHFSGGQRIAVDAFTPVVNPTTLRRLDPTVRGRVQHASLQNLGDMKLTMAPISYRGAPLTPELFYNEQRMTVARWPNKGWATISKIVDSGARPRDGDKSSRCPVFECSGNRPARWNVDAGVWLKGYWCYDWYAETIRVKKIDPRSHQISLAAPAHYSVKQGNPSPRRFYALNLLEELDQPGEYFINVHFYYRSSDYWHLRSIVHEPHESSSFCCYRTGRGYFSCCFPTTLVRSQC